MTRDCSSPGSGPRAAAGAPQPPGLHPRWRAAVLAVAIGIVGNAAAAASPSFTVAADGVVTVLDLPPVLAEAEVRRHLVSGLTTTFMLRAEVRLRDRSRARGAARVDVRWEPWDEVYHVAVMAADGRLQRQTLPSFDALESWWGELALPVTEPTPAAAERVDVDLQVLPFSEAEQLDAQRWFTGTLAPESAAAAGSVEPSRLSGVVDLLMATSIQRRALVRYRWQAQPREAPRPR